MQQIRLSSKALLLAAGLIWQGEVSALAGPMNVPAASAPAVEDDHPVGSDDAVYASPPTADLKAEVFAWLQSRNLLIPPVLEAIGPSWEFTEKPSAEALFDVLMRTYYLADEETRQLVDACRSWTYSPNLLQLQLPSEEKHPNEPRLIHNARYFLARHLTLLNAYNEALTIFRTIDLKSVVDPAGCLFHRAVCEHHLLMKKPGLKTLSLLLNQTQDAPVRYQKLAELMETDLQGVEEKSLGEVARQMRDVERRLSLNQTDEGVQEVENKIIATLDELIKKLEDQQSQSSSSGGGQGAPSNPAGDSYNGGVTGPGMTEKKDKAAKDHWGDLPPKAREDAKNMLDQQFPSHYRQAVEEYLKKLADRPAPKM